MLVAPDGSVWLAKPDGVKGQLRITSHGTAGNPYFSPSESTHGNARICLRRPPDFNLPIGSEL